MKRRLAFMALVIAGCPFASANAHAYLERSEPPANAVIAQLPSEIRLRLSEPLEPDFVSVSLLRDDRPVSPGPKVVLDRGGKTVLINPAADATEAKAAPGNYAVTWSVVAKDGHRTQGRLEFRVRPR